MISKAILSLVLGRLNKAGLDLMKIEDWERAKREHREQMHRVTDEMAGRLADKDEEIKRLEDELARGEALAASVRAGPEGTMTFRAHEAAAITKEVDQKASSPALAPVDAVPRLRSFDVGQRDEIVSAFRDQEVVLVRNAISKDWVEHNLSGLKRYFDSIETADSDKTAPETVKNLIETFRKQSGIGLSSSNDEFFPVPATIRNAMNPLKASGLIDCARHFFGSELFFMPDYSSVRRQIPTESEKALGWHQDGAAVGNVSENERGLVFWVPLTPLDDDTPGLEIALGKTSTLKPHTPTGASYNEIEDMDRVMRDYQDVLVQAPPMEVGDILLFSFNTIHRTVVKPGMTKTRYSLDLRAVPLMEVPWEYRGWLVIP